LRAVGEGKGKEWTVVMGNEAGDLDSMACAIALAWYTTNIKKQSAIPLIQTPRSDLHLRAENLYAIGLVGLDTKNPEILCLDEIPSSKPFPSSTFMLVDHNQISPSFTLDNPDTRIVAVIDHHDDEGLYKDTADPRVIQVPTGSCSSLVASLFAQSADGDIPKELATLLLCACLIDTAGLKPGGKAEDDDRKAAAYLSPRSLLTVDTNLSRADLHSDSNIHDLAEALDKFKSSVDSLNTRDLLRRDYKEYTMTPYWSKDNTILIGLSTVPIGIKACITKEPRAFCSSIEQWMSDRGLAAIGVLTSFRDPTKLTKKGKKKHRREQLWVVRTGSGVTDLAVKLFAGLEASSDLELKHKGLKKDYGIKKINGFSGAVEAKVWTQGNVEASRKVTAPTVISIIQDPPKTEAPVTAAL